MLSSFGILLKASRRCHAYSQKISLIVSLIPEMITWHGQKDIISTSVKVGVIITAIINSNDIVCYKSRAIFDRW